MGLLKSFDIFNTLVFGETDFLTLRSKKKKQASKKNYGGEFFHIPNLGEK